jgi:hypothetical protein
MSPSELNKKFYYEGVNKLKASDNHRSDLFDKNCSFRPHLSPRSEHLACKKKNSTIKQKQSINEVLYSEAKNRVLK